MWLVLLGPILVAAVAGPGAAGPNVSTIPRMVSYQGYLESNGAPFDGVANFKFVISCGTTVTAWSNDGTSIDASEPATAVPIQVDQGAFAVLLGDNALNMLPIEPEGFDACISVNLLIWVDTGSGFEALPAQPVVSSVFALEADSAFRAIGGFLVDGGPLVITDDQDQQVITLINKTVGPFAGPSLSMTNSDGYLTVSVVADSAGTGSPELRLFDSGGTERIGLDGATGEARVSAIRFGDDTVQTTAAGGGGGPDGDWTVSGSDMYAAVPGRIGMGTSSPLGHLTISRPTKAQDHQLELRVEGSITSPNYDGIRFTQGPAGETLLGEMRLDYRNNGVPDLGFHLRNQSNVLYMKGDSGNVGVGTSAPGAPLEVAGSANPILYVRQEQDLSADASIAIRGSRNGTTTANVASIEFRDFDSDEGGSGVDFVMARIGAGMGDVSGQTGYLRFYTSNGTSEVEGMRIDKTGNVGIGTTAPGAKLDVDGDIKVSGSVIVPARTRYLSLSTAAFTPDRASLDYSNSGNGIYGMTPGQSLGFVAPVNLPQGATITEIRAVVDDLESGSGQDFTVSLLQRALFSSGVTVVSQLFSSGAPGTYEQLAAAVNQAVDNQNYFYMVEARWYTPASGIGQDMMMRSVRITYTVTDLGP